MRVVTFNAQHGWVGGEPAGVAQVSDAVAALDADLVALQEVDVGDPRSGGVDQPAAVAAAIGGTSTFAAQREGGTTGVALVARGSITDVDVLRFVSRRGPKRDRPVSVPLVRPARRAIVLARATVGPLSVSVTSAHLDLVRPVSHGQLERVVAALAARPGPRLLLGDLNRRSGWVGPTCAAVGLDLLADDTPTHPVSSPVRRIDHLATSGLVVSRVEVVQLAVSDHRALVVDLDTAQEPRSRR